MVTTVFAASERSTLRSVWQVKEGKGLKERLKEGEPVVALRTGPCRLYLWKGESAKLVVECREIASNVVSWRVGTNTIQSPVASSPNGCGRHRADEAPAPPDQHVIYRQGRYGLDETDVRDEDPEWLCFRHAAIVAGNFLECHREAVSCRLCPNTGTGSLNVHQNQRGQLND